MVIQIENFSGNNRVFYERDLFYLNKGFHAKVYKANFSGEKRAVKIFNADCKSSGLKIQTYEVMKNLGLKRILKALEIFSKRQDIDIYNYDGYIMQLLDEDANPDILNFPTELLLSEFGLIDADAILLGQNNIMMKDVSARNSIITTDQQLWVTDTDFFERLYATSEDEIISHNRQNVSMLLRQLIMRAIDKVPEIDNYNNFLLKQDFAKKVPFSNEGIDVFAEMFENTDKPVEYFKKRC